MEKIKNKKEDSDQNEKNEEKVNMDKQAFILLGIFATIIIIALSAFAYMHYRDNFSYSGLKFVKTTQGIVDFYTTKIPLMDEQGKIISYITADFRNNPKELKNIKVNITNINFITNKPLYVSYGDLKICPDNMLAAVNLDIFLSDTGLKSKRSALSNQTYALMTNNTYANCQTNPDNTIILLRNGEETKVEQTAKNCYEIISNDCDILNATERFQLAMLEEYMKK
jgi:hypothetical protein